MSIPMLPLSAITSLGVILLIIPLCHAGGYQSTPSSAIAYSGIPRIYGEDNVHWYLTGETWNATLNQAST